MTDKLRKAGMAGFQKSGVFAEAAGANCHDYIRTCRNKDLVVAQTLGLMNIVGRPRESLHLRKTR
jgi:hypothetical protein